MLKAFNVIIIWRAGNAIGDQVLLAIFARELKYATHARIFAITTQPDLLRLCPYIDYAYSTKFINNLFTRLLYYFLKILRSSRLVEYNFPYNSFGYNGHLDAYQKGAHELLGYPPIWKAHIAWNFRYSSLLPDSPTVGALIPPKDLDIQAFIMSLRNKHPNNFIGIINPSGKTTFTSVKSFGHLNYSKLVDYLSDKITWIQIGPRDSLRLPSVVNDMRGLPLTRVLSLISYADFSLADEGLINHLAACCPGVKSFVISSGFSSPSYYSYINTFPLGYDVSCSCEYSPCWLQRCNLQSDYEMCKMHALDNLANELLEFL